MHLFDEPQFNTQDGYIGFMLDFFRKLRGEGRLVFVCLHPTERYHLEILREICERFLFVEGGRVTPAPDFASCSRTSGPGVRPSISERWRRSTGLRLHLRWSEIRA